MSNLISRQAVIDRINKLIEVEKKQGTDDWGYGRERVNAYEAMLHMVKSEYLYPSVEPERKVGKWIRFIEGDDIIHTGYMCSECKRTIKVFKGVKLKQFPYCHCGAKMVDEAESENKE